MSSFDDFTYTTPLVMVSDQSKLDADPKLKQDLEKLVDRACKLTGSRCGAYIEWDQWGLPALLVTNSDELRDLSDRQREFLKALIGNITAGSSLCVNDMSPYPRPERVTLPRERIIGVAVEVHEQTAGRLVLLDKEEPYNSCDVQTLETIGLSISLTIQDAKLQLKSANLEHWLHANHVVTTAMFEGADEEALDSVLASIQQVTEADTAVIILPSIGDTWACEFAHGHLSDRILGTVLPKDGRAMNVLAEKAGLIVHSFQECPSICNLPEKTFGPTIYAPLLSGDEAVGVLVLLRKNGSKDFEAADLPFAENIATQAAFALELLEARHAKDISALLEERERISSDLHDFAIQELFVAGIQLDAALADLDLAQPSTDELKHHINNALEAISSSVSQMRSIVQNLRDQDLATDLFEHLQQETSIARQGLGFAPSFTVAINNHKVLSADDPELRALHDQIDNDRRNDIAAVVREGLTNIARHAKATACSVRLEFQTAGSPWLHISIEDDGIGIDPNLWRKSGLANLRTRATRRGGNMTLEGGKNGGTLLSWSIPL
ncbi:MAG: GAF domain-containing protein [Actinomycetaceae bacterium]|nr:GAF domain-containing protein [Actinomycetaceae bacterium]